MNGELAVDIRLVLAIVKQQEALRESISHLLAQIESKSNVDNAKPIPKQRPHLYLVK